MAFFHYKFPFPVASMLFLFIFPRANSISFQISDFNSNANMVYYGVAEPVNGSIKFNGVSQRYQVGWACYVQKMLLWDTVSEELFDFKTHFSFSIKSLLNSTYGHGLAFFLAPDGIQWPLNSSGGFLDLFNTTKIDSIHSLHNGEKIDVWISYNAAAQNLTVSWTYQTASKASEKTSLSHQIDLRKSLPQWLTIGFSASVSHGEYSIEFWEFSSSSDENDHSFNDESEKAINTKLAAALIVWVTVLIIAIITAFLISLKQSGKQRKIAVKLTSIYTDLNRGGAPRRFSYRYLELATENFSNDRKLGEGGFGAVYKGHLPGANKTVAVKKISIGSKQGKKEYITEVKMISCLRHQNLVQLIGWCHDEGNFVLVYEFMANGGLDSHLFGIRSSLPWPLRYKICLGLASSLLYLHEQVEHSVVHRDIKSSNVLLDSDFNAKLGDFGLARLVEDNEVSSKAIGLAGTFGYMAPEYISTGRASKASDIFSYGVVLLEIVTGRKSTDRMKKDARGGLIEFVWNLYGKGQFLQALDEKLQNDFDQREAECLVVVGLWCAHPDPTKRPSIEQAIHVLNFVDAVPSLSTKMPVPIFNVASHNFSKLNAVYPCSSVDMTCLVP